MYSDGSTDVISANLSYKARLTSSNPLSLGITDASIILLSLTSGFADKIFTNPVTLSGIQSL